MRKFKFYSLIRRRGLAGRALLLLRRRRGRGSRERVQVGAQKRDARGVGGKNACVAGAGLPDLEGEVPLGVGVP